MIGIPTKRTLWATSHVSGRTGMHRSCLIYAGTTIFMSTGEHSFNDLPNLASLLRSCFWKYKKYVFFWSISNAFGASVATLRAATFRAHRAKASSVELRPGTRWPWRPWPHKKKMGQKKWLCDTLRWKKCGLFGLRDTHSIGLQLRSAHSAKPKPRNIDSKSP